MHVRCLVFCKCSKYIYGLWISTSKMESEMTFSTQFLSLLSVFFIPTLFSVQMCLLCSRLSSIVYTSPQRKWNRHSPKSIWHTRCQRIKQNQRCFFLFVLGLFSRLFFLRCSVNVLAKWRLALLKNFPSSSIKSGGSEGTCNMLEKPGSWRLC